MPEFNGIVEDINTQALSRCWAIHALATAQLANLADNGITTAAQTLEILFRDAGTVLHKRLDKLVTQFAESAPEFLKEYEFAHARTATRVSH